MRRAAKADTTSPEIVKALRSAGITVEPRLARVGGGVPDLLAGFRGHNVLLEVKTGIRDCDRKLTQDETSWHETWGGQVAVVSTADEAIDEVLRAAGLLALAGRDKA